MPRMDERYRVREPTPLFGLEPRKRGFEIDLVLRLICMSRLEEQDDLGAPIWDPVVGVVDHLVVRQPDVMVAAGDPCATVGGLAEDVDAPDTRVAIEHPALMRLLELVAGLLERRGLMRACDDEGLEIRKSFYDLAERILRECDLEIFVLAVLCA